MLMSSERVEYSIEDEEHATSPSLKMTTSLTEFVIHFSEHSSSISNNSVDSHDNVSEMGEQKNLIGRGDLQDRTCGCHSKLFYICVIAFVNMIGIGSVNNWCTLYFSSTLGTSSYLSTIGFAAFELFVIIGQISSDTIVQWFGTSDIIKYAGGVASVGMFIVVLAPSFPYLTGMPAGSQDCSINWQCAQVGVLGYAITGLGISYISPTLVSCTGELTLPNMSPTGQVGRLTGASYLGVLFGPLFFGELSMILNGLRWALFIGAIVMAFVPALAVFAFYDIDDEEVMSNENRSNRVCCDTHGHDTVSDRFDDLCEHAMNS